MLKHRDILSRIKSSDEGVSINYAKLKIIIMVFKELNIINIEDISEETYKFKLHYSTTKAGLIGMTRALAKELGPSGITVNAIAPGVIDTDMNSKLSKEDIADLCAQTPLGRVGTPLDVAKCALYLAGEGGDFITGEVINLSGGFVI